MTNFAESPHTIGPWANHLDSVDTAPPRWDEVDPMVRGVWNMAQYMIANQVVQNEHPWLNEYAACTLKGEQRQDDGDNWVTIGSDIDEYFYTDGFGGLKYNFRQVERALEEKEGYVHVDWMATPAAITSAARRIGSRLDLGISVGLSSHTSEEYLERLAQSNIHHIDGSILDPNVHAKMLDILDGRQIDLFTSRPKGGIQLLPLQAGSAAAAYYYHMSNFIYNRLSPGGFMFTETPSVSSSRHWAGAMYEWFDTLSERGVDASWAGGAAVIRKGDMENLPRLTPDSAIVRMDDRRLRCRRTFVSDTQLSKDSYLNTLEELSRPWE
ncbi:MAG: hypothetical protein ABWX94_01605 [Candidatus Saccharimonadales bacterium]